MKSRWLIALGMMFGVTTALSAQDHRPHLGSPVQQAGYVAVPLDAQRTQMQPYVPQPGDLLLYDDFNPLFHFAFWVVHTAPPTHTAIVVARADGSSASLELTGPRVLTAKVSMVDVEPRLAHYPGIVMVRRLRQPLTAEQSRELTRFAEAQVGKSFAVGRVALQATLLSPRFGLGRSLFGHTYLDRDRWFCSELVVAACATCGVLDPRAHCGNAIYPRDLAVDEALDLSRWYHPPVVWGLQSSAR
jgi:hypothetical protein